VICKECNDAVPAEEAPNEKIVMKCEYRMVLKETSVANLPGQAKDNRLTGYPEIRNGYLLNAILSGIATQNCSSSMFLDSFHGKREIFSLPTFFFLFLFQL
jgi:hypothetical protein